MIDPCDPETESFAVRDPLPSGAPIFEAPELLFVPARHFTAGRREAIALVVIHTAEVECLPGAAAAVAHYFAAPPAPEASAHYVVGPDLVVGCVREDDTAWHAPGANTVGIGIELTARATWSTEQWAAPEVGAMLERAAALVAAICRRHGIPIARLDSAALQRHEPGITGHVDVSKAWHGSDHWDPGPRFPWDHFLALVSSS